jgi:hypothetical protein
MIVIKVETVTIIHLLKNIDLKIIIYTNLFKFYFLILILFKFLKSCKYIFYLSHVNIFLLIFYKYDLYLIIK